jgi:predicted phosphodiesterase
MRNLSEAHMAANLAPASLAFLRSLPATRSIETSRGKLLLCHGLDANDMRQLRPHDDGYELECNDELQALLASKEFPLVVGGHTHARMVRRFGDVTVINAGTLKRGNSPCFCVVDLALNHAEFYDISDPAMSLLADAIEIP